MDAWGVGILLVGALIIIGLAALVDLTHYPLTAAAACLGAFLGAFVASEAFGALSEWGVVWFGVQLFPAVLGAVVGATAPVAVSQFLRGPTLSRPTPHRPLAR